MTALELPPHFRSRLAALASQGNDQGMRWVATSLEAPTGAGLRLLESRLTEFSSYWSHRRGPGASEPQRTMVGIGCALQHRLEGDSRFERAQAEIAASYRTILIPEPLKDDVRFFGGAAFSAGRDGSGSCWSDFGDASFFLPQTLYIDDGQSARLVVLLECARVDQTLDLVESVFAAFEHDVVPSRAPLFALSKTQSADESSWAQLLAGIKDRLREGQAQKIVAARRVTVRLSREPLLAEVLMRLDSLAPSCTHFALRLGKKTFLGATPELLVDKKGDHIETEALAGSISRSLENAEQLLLASEKDQSEHAFVVEAIVEQLSRICDQIEAPERPGLRHLARILHLRTPITAKLREQQHVLSVVNQLHPTPAVGGVPRREAIAWISENEPTERGWYASPFGWVDEAGSGQFVVALRSALLHEDKVHAYAGAGIVSQSDASLEFAETELKLTSMLGALGVES